MDITCIWKAFRKIVQKCHSTGNISAVYVWNICIKRWWIWGCFTHIFVYVYSLVYELIYCIHLLEWAHQFTVTICNVLMRTCRYRNRYNQAIEIFTNVGTKLLKRALIFGRKIFFQIWYYIVDVWELSQYFIRLTSDNYIDMIDISFVRHPHK